MESSASVPFHTVGFVTKETFETKMDEVQKALQTLLNQQQKTELESHGKKKKEMGTKDSRNGNRRLLW